MHGFEAPADGQVAAVPSVQVQALDTPGVTGEHELPDKVSPKNPHTCCSVEVVGSVTLGSFHFASAYSAPARVAPLSAAEVFISDP